MLEKRACVWQLYVRNFLGGIDVWGVFFVCSVYVSSSGSSFVLAVELDELLELSSQSNEVLFLPEVIEWVRVVEGV